MNRLIIVLLVTLVSLLISAVLDVSLSVYVLITIFALFYATVVFLNVNGTINNRLLENMLRKVLFLSNDQEEELFKDEIERKFIYYNIYLVIFMILGIIGLLFYFN